MGSKAEIRGLRGAGWIAERPCITETCVPGVLETETITISHVSNLGTEHFWWCKWREVETVPVNRSWEVLHFPEPPAAHTNETRGPTDGVKKRQQHPVRKGE